MSKEPTASIVMATRNRPELVGAALRSITKQTLQDFEVLITDDGSNQEALDRLREILGTLDSRFRLETPLYPGASGSGPAVGRNRGLARATGRFIAFLDDDDQWIWPEYLETAVAALDATGLDLYFADMEGYRGDTVVWDTWRLDKADLIAGERVAGLKADAYIVDRSQMFQTLRARIVHPNTVVLRRSLVEKTGPFLKWLYYAEDHEFVLRQVDHIERAVFGPHIVARYRFPVGNSSSLTMSALDQHLQHVYAAQRLRVTGQSRELKAAARREESWHLRMASSELRRLGRRSDARMLALRALGVRPSAGNLWHAMKTAW